MTLSKRTDGEDIIKQDKGEGVHLKPRGKVGPVALSRQAVIRAVRGES